MYDIDIHRPSLLILRTQVTTPVGAIVTEAERNGCLYIQMRGNLLVEKISQLFKDLRKPSDVRAKYTNARSFSEKLRAVKNDELCISPFEDAYYRGKIIEEADNLVVYI